MVTVDTVTIYAGAETTFGDDQRSRMKRRAGRSR
jgi:hypothetical protein